jgi:hypothetical protein
MVKSKLIFHPKAENLFRGGEMVKSRNAWYVFVLMCSTLLATGLVAADAGAAGIRGVVTDSSGKPVSGAIVSLANGHGRTESAYSDAEGTFSLTTLMEGKLSLRVRKRYHNDHVLTLRLTKKNQSPLDDTIDEYH